MDLSRLIHEIARWSLTFISVSAEIKDRAEAGLLTPEDCLVIADQLAMLGRVLAPFEAEKATLMGQESVRLIQMKQKEGRLRPLLEALHTGSEEQAWQEYLHLSRSMATTRRRPH